MTDSTAQTLPVIPDTESLCRPEDQEPLIQRIRDLSGQQYTTSWMLTEITAIATLLGEGSITAGALWQLVLSRYNIASSVSSTPDSDNESGWLTQPLVERSWVWADLIVLCAGRPLALVSALPGEYDEKTGETDTLRDQTLDFCARSLNLLWDRLGLSADDFLGRLEYSARHSIEHHLAIQWCGGPMAIGAMLHALPLPGGSFGLEGQPVYVLKAFVEALKRDITQYLEANELDTESIECREALGRIHLWWTIVKGYTHNMVHTYQGQLVVAMLANHPSLVEDLKHVLIQGRDLSNSAQGMTPQWGGGRGDCQLQVAISMMPTPTLIEQLDARIDDARRDAEALRNFR